MASIAVVGARGYVGKALSAALAHALHDVTGVTRENYEEKKGSTYDIVINCAMPSARFRAKNDPDQDFIETVAKTADLVYGWRFDKFVQISTVSARCQLDTVYGRNKAAAEMLCRYGNNLIVRLGAMYSDDLAKGVLVDLKLGKKVFVDGESRYCFAHRDFVAEWIAANIDRQGIIEVGGKNAIALKDIAAHLGAAVEFEGAIDHQEILMPEDDFPEAYDVFAFLDTWKMTP